LCRYAEETGDYAQQRELQSVIEALDSDGDGCIGLLDFVLFAARRKVINSELCKVDTE
jgi:Ca2+-binding EF-hand superfamily protein